MKKLYFTILLLMVFMFLYSFVEGEERVTVKKTNFLDTDIIREEESILRKAEKESFVETRQNFKKDIAMQTETLVVKDRGEEEDEEGIAEDLTIDTERIGLNNEEGEGIAVEMKLEMKDTGSNDEENEGIALEYKESLTNHIGTEDEDGEGIALEMKVEMKNVGSNDEENEGIALEYKEPPMNNVGTENEDGDGIAVEVIGEM